MGPDERLTALRAAVDEPELLLFRGHTVAARGVVDRSFLSQWWPAAFEVDGITYPTAEHWMMAGKARLFGDEQALRSVLAALDPTAAKAVGRAVRGFDDAGAVSTCWVSPSPTSANDSSRWEDGAERRRSVTMHGPA